MSFASNMLRILTVSSTYNYVVLHVAW